MTFEDWWGKNWPDFPHMHFAREVWNAATAAERQRCREIVEEVASASSIIGIGVANQIAEKIGE